MAIETPTAKGGGAKAPPPVEKGPAPGQTPNPAPSSSAAHTAAQHGGLPGGKPRKDGLKPGTPEALAADREKDRLRKQGARAVAAQLKPEPAALPAAVPGAAQPPVNGMAAVPPGGPAAPFVPWQAETIKPLVEKLLTAAEEGRVAIFAAKCKQLGEMSKLIKEIEEDAHFPAAAKVLLATSLPRLAAKWLNKSGISAEYQDEVACVTAILLIIQHDRKTAAKLDKLIAQTKAPKEPEKKEEQNIFGAISSETPAAGREVKPGTSKSEPSGPAPALGADQQIAKVNQ